MASGLIFGGFLVYYYLNLPKNINLEGKSITIEQEEDMKKRQYKVHAQKTAGISATDGLLVNPAFSVEKNEMTNWERLAHLKGRNKRKIPAYVYDARNTLAKQAVRDENSFIKRRANVLDH